MPSTAQDYLAGGCREAMSRAQHRPYRQGQCRDSLACILLLLPKPSRPSPRTILAICCAAMWWTMRRRRRKRPSIFSGVWARPRVVVCGPPLSSQGEGCLYRNKDGPRPGTSEWGLPEREARRLRLRRPRPVDSRKNFFLFRETKLFQFGENEGTVYAHFKRTTTALNEPGCNTVFILNRVLQTCSIWEVESLSTIFNRDIHTRSLLARRLMSWSPPHRDTPF